MRTVHRNEDELDLLSVGIKLLLPPMHTLKLIGLAIIQLFKQALLFPQMIAHAAKQRRQQVLFNEHEAERLDRIRNPSKYLGK